MIPRSTPQRKAKAKDKDASNAKDASTTGKQPAPEFKKAAEPANEEAVDTEGEEDEEDDDKNGPQTKIADSAEINGLLTASVGQTYQTGSLPTESIECGVIADRIPISAKGKKMDPEYLVESLPIWRRAHGHNYADMDQIDEWNALKKERPKVVMQVEENFEGYTDVIVNAMHPRFEKWTNGKTTFKKGVTTVNADAKAAKTQVAKDKAVQEREAKENAAREERAKKRAFSAKAAKEKATKDKATKEKAVKDKAAEDKPVKDQTVKEHAAKDKAAEKEEGGGQVQSEAVLEQDYPPTDGGYPSSGEDQSPHEKPAAKVVDISSAEEDSDEEFGSEDDSDEYVPDAEPGLDPEVKVEAESGEESDKESELETEQDMYTRLTDEAKTEAEAGGPEDSRQIMTRGKRRGEKRKAGTDLEREEKKTKRQV
jgi:hypothetical protein